MGGTAGGGGLSDAGPSPTDGSRPLPNDSGARPPRNDAGAVPSADAAQDAASDADVVATDAAGAVDAADGMDATLDASEEDAAQDAAADADAADADDDAGMDDSDPDECDDPPPCVCPHDPPVQDDGPCAPEACAIGDCAPDDACRYLTHAGQGYYFCDDRRTWEEARARCAQLDDLRLVSVDDAAEDAFILDNVSDKTWLGGSDGNGPMEGRWLWTDGTPFFIEDEGAQGGAYVNWHASEPNNIGLSDTAADCLLLWYENEVWADGSCGDRHGYVCEVER